jgi:hypothetical protein
MNVLLERFNPTNRLMGDILVQQQWITPDQLGKALSEQGRTNQRLGEILVRLSFLTEMELTFILSQQKGNTLTGDSDSVKQRLGDILRKSKRLSQHDLSVAVDEQKRTNEKLGSVLLRLGLLEEQELGAVLAWQDDFNSGDPMAVRLLLGEILIASKRISRKQLGDALEKQRLTKKQVGQVLLECGFVSKFDLRNALKIQSKMVAAGLLVMLGAGMLSGCGTPTVPSDMQSNPYGTSIAYGQSQTGHRQLASIPGQFDASKPNQTATTANGRQIQVFQDGSHVVANVPFIHQGDDRTCAQAASSVVLNYWGVKTDYQTLIKEQNAWNLPTGFDRVVSYMQSKGLQAQAYRRGNVSFLKHLVDNGQPAMVMLEFNNDLLQQHYVTVVGYNEQSGQIIYHDSIDGPYQMLDQDTFTQMWQAKDLVNVPIFGGGNYQGLIIEVNRAAKVG